MSTTLTVGDCWYTVEKEGFRGSMPIIHLTGRDADRNWRHVEVVGFRPYFLVPLSEARESASELADDDRVLSIEFSDRRGRDERSVHDERLARIVVEKPYHVKQLRDAFESHIEADILFPDRFQIDKDIKQTAIIPNDADERRIHHEEIEGGDGDAVPLRVATYDIEVEQASSGPSVVSEEGTYQARQPITAISLHDSYDDEYHVWVLAHQSWDGDDISAIFETLSDVDVDIGRAMVYDDERSMLSEVCTFLTETRFDVLQGWNSNGFDTPYFVNRCFSLDVFDVVDLSPTEDVSKMNGDGRWLNGDLEGIVCFDLLQGYEKTQVHELDSFALANVAAVETAFDKLAIGDIDEAWETAPTEFVKYNLRDTQATVAIDENVGVVA